ncbi:MAG: glycoside hydrolase family 3 protein [Clostridiales bacterium]|nr:glycoside hydrolase family 3 protein [Clostridiales bacterium]
MKNRKIISVALACAMILSLSACNKTDKTTETGSTTAETTEASSSESTSAETSETTEDSKPSETSVSDIELSNVQTMTPEELVATLTLDQKAAQMVQPALYNITENSMKTYDYGSVLSTYGQIPNPSAEEWCSIVDSFQDGALASDAKIPYIYGQDSVHGVNYASGTVIYPQNINIGAANDIERTILMGQYVGSDIMRTKMILNFSPCVAAAQDPRWGRTYESYSSDPALIKELSVAYATGLLDEGIVVCAKHFICEGYTTYGSGENPAIGMILDRGNAEISEDVINENLAIYQALVDSGVQSIMISHSALNGTKMHEYGEYIMKIKNEMGFEGFILSDWDSIENCSGATLKDNVVLSINAGIDMLMEADHFEECRKYIVEAVNEGLISQERVDDAVTRIIRVKMEAGLFEDPYLLNKTPSFEWNCDESIENARILAEESLVPIKDGGNLTIKEGSKVFVAGPAANDMGVMLGGWSYIWQGISDEEYGDKVFPDSPTILEALEEASKDGNFTIVTDESEISSCDMVLLCLGEMPYSEWYGDAEDLSITGDLGLDGNKEAIDLAKKSGLPTTTLLICGRNVIIEDYINDWDSVLMCYLPGSEGGNAICNALTGKCKYKGHLPMPYYKSETDIDSGNVWLPLGYSALDN